MILGCKDTYSPQETQITVDQRRASIDAAMEYLDAGRFTESLAIMQLLSNKDPRGPETQESFGIVLLACAADENQYGDPEQEKAYRSLALDAYITACQTATSPGLLQLSTAQLAHMQGAEHIALTYYNLAHDSNPKDARASFFIAQIQLLNKNWLEAKTWIDRSILRDPTGPHALLSSALVEAELGNKEVAILRARKGCSIQPDDPNLRFIQARVLRISGQPIHALDILSSLPNEQRSSDLVREEIQMCNDVLQENIP